MPRLTGEWKVLPTDLPPAHREFVEMLRRLRDCSHRRQADIAAAAHLVLSSLSNHLNGGRIPEEPQVIAFFKAIRDENETTGGQATALPCSLDELLELRRQARMRHCACVPHAGAAADSSPADDPPAFLAAAPAAVSLPRTRRMRRSSSQGRAASRSTLRRALARRQVPVPAHQGDRPRTALTGGADWTELETLTAFLTEGRHRDAGLLLWRAGRTLSAAELLDAVGACRSAGLAEAAEAVLTSVSGRPDRQAVLNIVAAFQHAGRGEDVAYLLSAAREP
ncbi:hypothetical protein ABZW02_18385 [Streptomyces sp. NPDC005180]|uniref:hypothetical protein n=1 Tax=Streptomyces sp. NPDC005180 TaxID=3156868 RepID=UPI0033AF634B